MITVIDIAAATVITNGIRLANRYPFNSKPEFILKYFSNGVA
jgi:hypothetical protein